MKLFARVCLPQKDLRLTRLTLSTKMVTLYRLKIQQLLKQDHYDFDLIAIQSVLLVQVNQESENARENQKKSEMDEVNQKSQILMRAIKDMNLPKFASEDVPFFNDLFPNGDLQEQIKET